MITPKEIDNLAELARIKLSEADKESLAKDIDSILGYIGELKKAPVSLDAESRVGRVKNVTRPDVSVDTSQSDRQKLLDEVPQRVGEFVAVKKIL